MLFVTAASIFVPLFAEGRIGASALIALLSLVGFVTFRNLGYSLLAELEKVRKTNLNSSTEEHETTP